MTNQSVIRRAILWDVDGTLSDSFMLGYVSTLKVLENNSLPTISQETYHQGTRYTTTTRMAWHATGDPSDEVGVRLGLEFDDLYIKQVSMGTAPFYPGIRQLLLSIADKYGLTYGAISNASGAYITSVLAVNDVSHLFDITVGADEVAVGKPHPEGILRCSAHLQAPATHSIYIGDSPTDGQAATAAGMTSVGVTWGSYSLEQLTGHFTHIVHTVEELETKLCELMEAMH